MSSLQLLPRVFALPSMLPMEHIAGILSQRKPGLLSLPGHGEEEEGHYVDSAHLEEHEKRKREKERKRSEDHRKPKKPHKLQGIAECLWPAVEPLVRDEKAVAVDPMMRLYRLPEGAGEVAPHRDEDFDGPAGSIARWSLLVYLSDDFDGGETVFSKNVYAPHVPAGGGLLFRHDVLHEGLKVQKGSKFVLKTDIFCH